MSNLKRYNITVNGKTYDVSVEEIETAESSVAQSTVSKTPAAVTPPTAPIADGTRVSAPMPGTVLEIKVNVGDSVKSGQALVVLEAMKMENDISSPCDGKVLSVNVERNAAVETGTLLCVVG